MSRWLWQFLVLFVAGMSISTAYRVIPDRFAFWRVGLITGVLLGVWYAAQVLK